MNNVDNGPVDDPGIGQERGAVRDERSLEKKDGEERRKPEDCSSGHEFCETIENGEESPELVARKIAPYVIDAIVEDRESIERLLFQKAESWSGILPDPDSFAKYPDYVQKRMVEWNDAQIIDESRRNDRIVDAAIRQTKWGQILSASINGISVLAAFISYMVTRDGASFGFLAVPGITIAVNIVLGVKKRKNRSTNDDSGKE